MNTADITRVPNKTFPAKSSVAIYRLPGGGGFLWAVATSPDRTQDIRVQTLGALGVIDNVPAEYYGTHLRTAMSVMRFPQRAREARRGTGGPYYRSRAHRNRPPRAGRPTHRQIPDPMPECRQQ